MTESHPIEQVSRHKVIRSRGFFLVWQQCASVETHLKKIKKITESQWDIPERRQTDPRSGTLLTNLKDLVVDAVDQGVGPHPDIQVGVTEPLHCLVHIGD